MRVINGLSEEVTHMKKRMLKAGCRIHIRGTSIGMRSTQDNAESALRTEAVTAAAAPVVSPEQPRILVVDDDSAVRETLTLLLASAGYDTASARTAFEALERIEKQPPKLLLCDLEMPNMSGFELVSIVRNRFPEIAVVAMSGSFSGDMREVLVADAFYRKGHRGPADLFRIVAGVLATTSSAGSRGGERPVVWSHWISRDAGGESFVLVNCTECLRCFPVPASVTLGGTVCATQCAFCHSEVRYVAERFSADLNFSALFSAAFGVQAEQEQPGKTGRLNS
jgi:CheY-like chemotaxis protein